MIAATRKHTMTGSTSTPPAQGCGQEAAAGAVGCGQEVAEPSSGGHGEVPPSACGQEPEGACGHAQGIQVLDPEEMAAWRTFLSATVTVTSGLNHELEAGAGISMHEYEILVRLSEAPERTMRMSTLAEQVSHSRSRLTHTVGRLEKEGYVERAACPADRRGVNCHLTDTGLAFLRQVAPIHLHGVRRHVIDRLERDQLAELTHLLGALCQAPDQ